MRPSASGRSPCGSRKATTASSVMTTVENAPFSRGRTSAIASSIRSAGWVASSAAMISESEVELERDVAPAQLGVQLDGVDQVAVVGQRQRAAVVADDRLGVLPLRGAGGGVAHVADRHVADQRAQRVLVEHLGDQALVADAP